jgi:hypothetical protein
VTGTASGPRLAVVGPGLPVPGYSASWVRLDLNHATVARSPCESVARCETSTAGGVPVHGSALLHRAPTSGVGALASTTAGPGVATVPAVDVVLRAAPAEGREPRPDPVTAAQPIRIAATRTATANSAICRRRRTVRRRRAARVAARSVVCPVDMQRNRVAVGRRSIHSHGQLRGGVDDSARRICPRRRRTPPPEHFRAALVACRRAPSPHRRSGAAPTIASARCGYDRDCERDRRAHPEPHPEAQ